MPSWISKIIFLSYIITVSIWKINFQQISSLNQSFSINEILSASSNILYLCTIRSSAYKTLIKKCYSILYVAMSIYHNMFTYFSSYSKHLTQLFTTDPSILLPNTYRFRYSHLVYSNLFISIMIRARFAN